MMLDYEVVYSDRKTIAITVERNRKVVVRVPHQASEKVVADVVERKRFWIWEKINNPHKYPDPMPRKEYVEGETFLFLGQHYSLALTNGETGAVRLSGQQFELAKSNARNGNALFRAWYLCQARAMLPARIAAIAAAMGVGYKRICVRDLKYRWGSCTPGGTLTFNWRIIQAPMIVVDYLIAHELAHILIPNHSEEFWNMVAVQAPGYAKARGWLKEHGGRLEW